MRVSEWIVVLYVTYLVVTAWVTRRHLGARLRITYASAAILVVVTALPLSTNSWWISLARDWAPGIYILFGYWLSGLFFVQPDRAAEARLRRLDHALFTRTGLNRAIAQAPRAVLEFFELAYLFCYLQVPAGFATVYLQGPDIDVDRFWTIVLTAVFACYGALPWIPTRAPRQLEPDPPIDRRGLVVRRVNLWLLDRASIQVNTFPSGHYAAYLATAI
ncbi:MAG: hypothetical protein ACRD1T_05075 [Acidimicrobiia bacterium]